MVTEQEGLLNFCAESDENMQPLISVIVPCYNVEQYIDRCMDTLVKQTIGIENLEIILVNDASTDSTYEKLCQWEQKYPEQVMIISYEENLRQGGARNVGLQYARADYVGFVDSDDWIELDMYETLYEKVKEKSYDVVSGKFIRESYPGEKEFDNLIMEDQEYCFQKKEEWYVHAVGNTGQNGEYGSICTAIFKKSNIVENNIYFPEKLIYEDNFWKTILNLYISSLFIVDRVVYHYYINPNSTVTSHNAKNQLDRLVIEEMILEEYKIRGAFEHFKKDLEWGFIQRFYLNTMYIIFLRFDYIPDIFGYMKSTVLKNFPEYKSNPHMEKCNLREQQLLRLLEIPRDLTLDELNKIKMVYLKTF